MPLEGFLAYAIFHMGCAKKIVEERNRMSRGDLDFRKIHDDFWPKILRYLTRLVGEHDAEDLTQEVFVKINHALRSFRGESQLSTWIYRIATNAAVDRLRSPSFQHTVQRGVSVVSIAESEIARGGIDTWRAEEAPLAETSVIRTEMNECIRGFVENLPADYRTVLVLSELEGVRNSDIAEIVGITLDTVKIRLHRARVKLKKELEANCSFYRDERNELACDLKSAFREFRKEY
jgi:RNA polymerase sigma-70 factor (ECF subfamily)